MMKSTSTSTAPKEKVTVVREQDRLLPIANVSRIMKKSLPTNAKIAKDARETMQECVSEFISFITSEASDKCLQEKRKTINGEDILWALSALGFDQYINPLNVYLEKYKEVCVCYFFSERVRTHTHTHATTTTVYESRKSCEIKSEESKNIQVVKRCMIIIIIY